MSRFWIYLIGIATAVGILLNVTGSIAVGVWTGVATGLLVPLIDAAVSNFRYMRLAYWSVRLANKHVRISVSYLFRIEVDGRFLLVRGHRYPGQFQPVGGVYKFADSVRDRFARWHVQNDDLIPIDSVSSDDLRVRVPGRNLIPFIRWFESGMNRESGPWREFCEELIVPGHLAFEDFWNVRSEYVRTRINPVRFSQYADSYELLVADIYRLDPSEAQKRRIVEAVDSSSGSDLILLVSRKRCSLTGSAVVE
ncbi:hypothetical protein [Pseudonocardia sp. ICBG1293]|uniref:SMODS-associated NUDIX domain-containing protein n=1 Tax=Pseudonocardia sp. ICBG1293 TaxID=2844382 RepID=UPI0035A93FF0